MFVHKIYDDKNAVYCLCVILVESILSIRRHPCYIVQTCIAWFTSELDRQKLAKSVSQGYWMP